MEVHYLTELAAAVVAASDRDDGDQVVEATSDRHGDDLVAAAAAAKPQGCMEVVVRVVEESSKGNSYLNNIVWSCRRVKWKTWTNRYGDGSSSLFVLV